MNTIEQNTVAQQWKSVTKSIWKNALTIGICMLLSSLATILFTITDISLIYVSVMILGLIIVTLVAQWHQVSNINNWLTLTIRNRKSATYKNLERIRSGLHIQLRCVLVCIPIFLLYVLALVTGANEIFMIAFNFIFACLAICLIYAVIKLIMGACGLAFTDGVDANISRGMKYFIAYLVINIIVDVSANVCRFNGIPTDIITPISLVSAIIYLISWRHTTRAEALENPTHQKGLDEYKKNFYEQN